MLYSSYNKYDFFVRVTYVEFMVSRQTGLNLFRQQSVSVPKSSWGWIGRSCCACPLVHDPELPLSGSAWCLAFVVSERDRSYGGDSIINNTTKAFPKHVYVFKNMSIITLLITNQMNRYLQEGFVNKSKVNEGWVARYCLFTQLLYILLIKMG